MKHFKALYYFAIIGGLIAAGFGRELGGHFFFLWSLGTMLVLSGIGFFVVPAREAAAAGARLQTAGYLYALMGFMGAIYGMTDVDDLGRITTPLAAALLTSVMGWFFGGELAERKDPNAAQSPEEAAAIAIGVAIQKLEGVLQDMRQNWTSFAASCKEAESATQELFRSHVQLSKEMLESANHLHTLAQDTTGAFTGLDERLAAARAACVEHLGENFLEGVRGISESAAQLGASLATIGHEAGETARFLSDWQALSDQLASTMEALSRGRQQQHEAALSLAAGVRSALDPLTMQIQKLNEKLQHATIETEGV